MTTQPATDTREALTAAAEALKQVVNCAYPTKNAPGHMSFSFRVDPETFVKWQELSNITAALSPAVGPTSAEERANAIVNEYVSKVENGARDRILWLCDAIRLYGDAEYRRGYEAGKAAGKMEGEEIRDQALEDCAVFLDKTSAEMSKMQKPVLQNAAVVIRERMKSRSSRC